MDEYEVLGHQLAQALKQQDQQASAELLACALSGNEEVLGAFDWTQLINAGAEAANKGVQYKQQQDADAAAKSASAAAAARAIAADVNWASAEQQLELASKDPAQVPAAAALQQAAMMAAMQAGAGLSQDAQTKRAQAAQDASNKAAHASLAAPHDAKAAAFMHGWQKVLAGATAGLSPSALDLVKKGSHGGASWWMSPQWGGVPGWGVAVGGTGIAVGLILLLKKLLGR